MSLRLAALAFPLTIVAALAACQSSGRYASPGYVGTVTGAAVAGAAVNRAAGGCWAQCIAGTVCNKATGLCEGPEVKPSPAPGAVKQATASGKRPAMATASYPPGHEYSVPPADGADAGCDPTSSDNGSLSCEMDASAPH
ncbi:MAG: hypothetical protein QM820_51495 [Minicystis sp.]